MTTVHDRLSLSVMLNRGRKSRHIQGMIRFEAMRLVERIEDLAEASSRKGWVGELASDQARRLEDRLGVITQANRRNQVIVRKVRKVEL